MPMICYEIDILVRGNQYIKSFTLQQMWNSTFCQITAIHETKSGVYNYLNTCILLLAIDNYSTFLSAGLGVRGMACGRGEWGIGLGMISCKDKLLPLLGAGRGA